MGWGSGRVMVGERMEMRKQEGGDGEERVDRETGGVDKADWWGFGWFLLWREMVNGYPWEM